LERQEGQTQATAGSDHEEAADPGSDDEQMAVGSSKPRRCGPKPTTMDMKLLAPMTGAEMKHMESSTSASCLCAICSRKGSADLRIIKHADGNGCTVCYAAYEKGFKYRTWKSIVAECKTSKLFLAFFLNCVRVNIGEIEKDFNPCSVQSFQDMFARTERRFIGLTRSEFNDAFGVFPEVLRLKLSTLVDEFGSKYQGVLLHDPAQPWRYHVMSSSKGQSVSSDTMPASNQFYETQGLKYYDKGKDAGEKDNIGKAKKAWGFKELQKKAKDHLDSLCTAPEDSEHAIAKVADDQSTSADGGADSVFSGLLGSMEAIDIASLKSGGRGTPPSKRQWKTIKVVKGEVENHLAIANWWLGKLTIESALSGIAVGREKHETLLAAQRLREAESHSFATQLMERHAYVAIAETLTVASIAQLPWPKVHQSILELNGVEVKWPIDNMWALVKKYAEDRMDAGDMDEWVQTMSPWNVGEETLFDASKPRLRDFLEDLPQRFARFEREVLDNAIATAMHRREKGAQAAGAIAEGVLEFIVTSLQDAERDDGSEEEQLMDDENPVVPSVMAGRFDLFLMTLRCVSFTCRRRAGKHGQKLSDVIGLEKRTRTEDCHDSPASRIVAIMKTEYWKTIVGELKSYAIAEDVARDDLEEADAILAYKPVPPARLKRILDILDKHENKIQPVLTKNLMTEVVSAGQWWLSNFTEHVTTGVVEGAAKTDFLMDFGSFLRHIHTKSVINDAQLEDAMKAVQDTLDELSASGALAALVQAASQYKDKAAPGDLDDLKVALKNAKAGKFHVTDSAKQEAAPLLTVVQQLLSSWSDEFSGAIPMDFAQSQEVIEDVFGLYDSMPTEIQVYKDKVTAWVEWDGFLKSVAKKVSLEDGWFEKRQAAMAVQMRLAATVRKAMPLIIAENKQSLWATLVDQTSASIEQFGNHDMKVSKAQVDVLITALDEATKNHRDGKWHAALGPEAEWKAIVKIAGAPGGLAALDVDDLEKKLVSLKAERKRCEEIWSFFSCSLDEGWRQAAESMARSVTIVVACGCLALGLGTARNVAEARKIAAKQQKKLKPYSVSLACLEPSALGKKATEAMNYIS